MSKEEKDGAFENFRVSAKTIQILKGKEKCNSIKVDFKIKFLNIFLNVVLINLFVVFFNYN